MTNPSQESYKKILAATSEEEIKALADNIKDFPMEKWANGMFSLASQIRHGQLCMYDVTR